MSASVEHLQARLSSLDGAVQSLRTYLRAPPPVGLGDVAERWRSLGEDVRRSFEVEADHLVRQIDAERTKLRAANVDASTTSEAWRSVASIGDQARGLADEIVLFANGVLARSLGLDDGYCATVDLLLTEVAEKTNLEWNRITVPATNYHSSGRAELIGVRLDDRTMWSMPLAVHELGHYAAERLGFRRRRLAAEVVEASPSRPDFGEHFADLYAAIALGPAYLAMLVERGDPSGTTHPRDHPPWQERVYIVRHILEKRTTVAVELTQTLTQLSSFWERCCEAAGSEPWPEADVCEELDEFAMKADEAIQQSAPRETLEPSWSEVGRATAELQADKQPTTRSPRVVVNAAWRARLRLGPQTLVGEAAAAAIEQRARGWFDIIMDGG